MCYEYINHTKRKKKLLQHVKIAPSFRLTGKSALGGEYGKAIVTILFWKDKLSGTGGSYWVQEKYISKGFTITF